MKHRTGTIIFGAALVAMFAVGCSNGDDTNTASTASATGSTTDSTDGTAVAATVKDFELTVDPDASPAGEINFTITNDGPSTHEFVVVKSNLAPDALPVADGLVSEDSIDVVDEAEDIAPGTTASLGVELEAGSYVIICNIAGHYEQGMHAGLTVS
jgi:uncharacterized cupredoxin-like copper-binding protein